MLPILRILPVGGVLLAILILVLALSPPDGSRAPFPSANVPARGALVDRDRHPEMRQFLIHAALKRFRAAGRGVIVFLRDGTAGVPVAEIPHEDDSGADAARSRQWREIGLGAQILKDLGISSIRLLTSSKRTYVGLGGFDIEIVATEPIES